MIGCEVMVARELQQVQHERAGLFQTQSWIPSHQSATPNNALNAICLQADRQGQAHVSHCKECIIRVS